MIEKIKNNEQIISNLNYLGLQDTTLPDSLKNFEPLNFRPSKMYDERKYMVYRDIKISDIEIMITPTDRITPLNEKYTKACPLFTYLDSESEENIEKYVTFLKMVKNINIEKIEEIEREQDEFKKHIPFQVKYFNNYLWQVYYSEISNRYFMLVPTEESETEAFFYLLKKKLQNSQENIFIPISHQEYTGEFLNRSEIIDLENYLWLFTKDWPSIYEVFKDGEARFVIVGKTVVYNKIKSEYKIEFTDKKSAREFFKLLKALFIIKTNLESEYDFSVRLNEQAGLDFYFKDEMIKYEDLSSFITNQVKLKIEEINQYNKKNYNLGVILEKQKRNAEEQNTEFLYKQNQLVTYLNCKKTFLGKISYFFKSNKKNKKFTAKKRENVEASKKVELQVKKYEDLSFDDEKQYTIEDLIETCKKHKKSLIKYKNLELDKKAIETKIEMVETRIESIEKYIKEIERHKKNIWEFLKYVKKDENKSLMEGRTQPEEKNEKLQRVFKYDEDIEDFGRQIDEIQRKKLSKEETDSIYIALSESKFMNLLESGDNKEKIISNLARLKEEYQKDNKTESNDYDIFGALSDDITKIKTLKNRRHREVEKNKYKLLNIKSDMAIQEYINSLSKYKALLENAFNKISTSCNLVAYTCEEIGKQICIFDLDDNKIIENIKQNGYAEITKINIPEKSNALFASNIVFYDNYNRTLPLGMDLSTKIVVDLKKYKLEKISQSHIKVNFRYGLFENEVKDIKVIEYNLK